MDKKGASNTHEQLGLLPHREVDWSRLQPVRRVWLDEVGGDSRARLEFLADQGLRLLMADNGPDGRETLHFYNPRDRETLHLRASGGRAMLCEAAAYFPAARRWIELMRGDAERFPPAGYAGAWLTPSGLWLEVTGGRVRRVCEAWREFPQGLLHGCQAGRAGLILEGERGAEGVAMAAAITQAVEEARGMRVPVAALAMRALLVELARVHHHLAWFSAACVALERRRTAEGCERLRGELEAAVEEWLGDRLGRGWSVPGGIREGIPLHGAAACAAKMETVTAGWRELSPRLGSLPVPSWAEKRLSCLPGEAEKSAWVGPLARAAGSGVDARSEEPGVYALLAWEKVELPDKGGMLRRVLAARAGEVSSSLRFARDMLEHLPGGPLLVKRGRAGRGEGFGRCEGPEGETCCHVVLGKGKVFYAAFSLPRELNRSAARALEDRMLDEAEILSLAWEGPFPPPRAAE